MPEFMSRCAEFAGRFTVTGPIKTVFDLFSPLGERLWVPDWSPELLYPPGAVWARGQIFRTREETGEAVWVVTVLNREAHEVEYHRVEPQRYVARVGVKCAVLADETTEVSTTYAFVGLSSRGNSEIASMTFESYSRKMERWEQWISGHLTRAS